MEIEQKKPEIKEEAKDIVCAFSQGRLDEVRQSIGIKNKDPENTGSLACAIICLKAMESFFTQGLPKDEKAIYHLIHEGASQYTQEKRSGLLEFDDVYAGKNSRFKDKLENYIPTASDGIDPEVAGLYEAIGGIQAPVSTQLDPTLKCLQNKAMEGRKTCAVMTTQSPSSTNATIVIMFDENNKPALFNSHGEPYKGQDLGASLLRFDNMNQLSAYIKGTLFKHKDGEFQLKILVG